MAVDPLAQIPVVSIEDSALDLDAMGEDLATYARTRDPKLIKVKPGAKATTFHVKGMTVGYLAEIVKPARDTMRALLSILACVHEVETDDGRRLAPEKLVLGAYKQKIANDAWLDLLRDEVGLDALEEIGNFAYERARLPAKARRPFGS